MPFRAREIVWDDWNEEHVARHHVTPFEVDEVCFSDPLVLLADSRLDQRDKERSTRSVSRILWCCEDEVEHKQSTGKPWPGVIYSSF